VTDFTTERLLRIMTKAPGAFWRHDVDISLEAAAKMARFAQLAGVQATFYIMPRGEFYNPFSRAGAQAISAIHNHGQRLGIHCDYRTGDIHDAVKRDGDILEVGYPGLFNLELVSFHMPPGSVLWRDFTGFENAYAPKWMGRYVADSRRQFGPEKEARVSNSMQIGLHPEHWFA